MKELLSGNEAIARGAYEHGVAVAAAYPGTPSTEILENFARYPGVYAEWAPNEKVALEVGIGASLAGARVLVAMKNVGVNVAADPLVTLAYTGVNGGVVLVSADDPGIHSSQNEQDNRRYAFFAKIPLLEPGDSQEAKEMVGIALEISELYDTPVMLRITTRVAHSLSFVEVGDPQPGEVKKYAKNAGKYVMLPVFARMRRVAVEKRLAALKEYSGKSPLNRIEWREKSVGVITSGISYQYVREAVPDASVLKLGMTNPLPEELIRQFAGAVERLIVVEELEPFIEEQVRSMGLNVSGKEIVPYTGELNTGILIAGFAEKGIVKKELPAAAVPVAAEAPAVPNRPPVMCPGCPHRGVFYALRRLGLTVTGDIGCYTLGALPPLEAMDSCICMGASIGIAHGAAKADPELGRRTVAVIGDSTFLHSGMTGLLNMVYNKGSGTVIILDNGTTAMTGHQHHPGTGKTLMGEQAPAVDFELLTRALGVRRVKVVDPLNLAETEEAVLAEIAAAEPSVIISRRPCVLLGGAAAPVVLVRADRCTGCRICVRLGCPAISVRDKTASVDPITCTGCGLCVQVCRKGALAKEGEPDD
ncbi:MAG TPA: indolepyruvate ferredoxin oxidoreductase subunit alpha [Bacillota bacterium]|nr:indolepyruvate ferredoxin oxidoreductase subunit alpha [Bacillota bacterium]